MVHEKVKRMVLMMVLLKATMMELMLVCLWEMPRELLKAKMMELMLVYLWEMPRELLNELELNPLSHEAPFWNRLAASRSCLPIES